MDGLLRLVDDLRALRTAWEREPFVSAGLGDFSDVFSLDAAERLVHSGLPLTSVRLFRDGELLPSEAILRDRGSNARSREKLADNAKVTESVGAGATLVLEELQTYSPEVAGFAAALTRETGYEADCTAFLTPARARGIAPHYDPVSVFLRQVHGSKRWQISAPTKRWPSRVEAVDPRMPTEPVLDVVLKEGECLYIPRGFVHVGETTDEPSLHLSTSLRSVTWETVLRSLLAAAAEQSEPLREALPPVFAEFDGGAVLRERVDVLTEYLAGLDWSRISLRQFRARQSATPYVPGGLAAALSRSGEGGPNPAQ
ncbi:cupin domain-containing protein [Streptomyces sp. SID3343]|uniref:cupin domain-containing protein n=1 Tax=Streptomyces sp. SID3343 TaxID=2690260 RepID=UPI00136AF1A5|nr:cupin domain-containing protein [Streptomyces sp. SID3343]MYV98881.1 hypothetical protein [Streptomyces sp. SID3343]